MIQLCPTFNYSIHDLLLQQRNAEWMNILSHDETKTGKVSHCNIPRMFQIG